MSFALLSPLAVLLGIALLAIGLWIAQRLRVQHREVEVISTLFWRAAIDEKRVRVFTRRFRHWPAWALLVGIATLIWALFATPTTHSIAGTQHVVLVDRSEEDAERRIADLDLAIERASTLPTASREIIAADAHPTTLLAQGESVEHVNLRVADETSPSADNLHSAIQAISARGNENSKLVIHVVSDSPIDQEVLDSIHPNIEVVRVLRDTSAPIIELETLGLSDAASGDWSQVDVSIALTSSNSTEKIDTSELAVRVNDTPLQTPLQKNGPGTFLAPGITADGGVLTVSVAGKELGTLTLPDRKRIQVALGAQVPNTLRELIAMDPACEIVDADAEILVGTEDDADFRLATADESAFRIESEQEDVETVLSELVDRLALKQIDATSIAEQSGKVIDVQIVSADKRKVAVWSDLFTTAYDFPESRACPIFVARSIRWLAQRPKIVPWAQRGGVLPVAATPLDRATQPVALTSDGREIRTSRFSTPISATASIAESPPASIFSWLRLSTWIGLLLVALLLVEWTLYQRGRMP